jgi:hypothetical protein
MATSGLRHLFLLILSVSSAHLPDIDGIARSIHSRFSAQNGRRLAGTMQNAVSKAEWLVKRRNPQKS